jgi:hypothetical protein
MGTAGAGVPAGQVDRSKLEVRSQKLEERRKGKGRKEEKEEGEKEK